MGINQNQDSDIILFCIYCSNCTTRIRSCNSSYLS